MLWDFSQVAHICRQMQAWPSDALKDPQVHALLAKLQAARGELMYANAPTPADSKAAEKVVVDHGILPGGIDEADPIFTPGARLSPDFESPDTVRSMSILPLLADLATAAEAALSTPTSASSSVSEAIRAAELALLRVADEGDSSIVHDGQRSSVGSSAATGPAYDKAPYQPLPGTRALETAPSWEAATRAISPIVLTTSSGSPAGSDASSITTSPPCPGEAAGTVPSAPLSVPCTPWVPLTADVAKEEEVFKMAIRRLQLTKTSPPLALVVSTHYSSSSAALLVDATAQAGQLATSANALTDRTMAVAEAEARADDVLQRVGWRWSRPCMLVVAVLLAVMLSKPFEIVRPLSSTLVLPHLAGDGQRHGGYDSMAKFVLRDAAAAPASQRVALARLLAGSRQHLYGVVQARKKHDPKTDVARAVSALFGRRP